MQGEWKRQVFSPVSNFDLDKPLYSNLIVQPAIDRLSYLKIPKSFLNYLILFG